MRLKPTLTSLLLALAASTLAAQTITVSFPASLSSHPLDGRVLFLLSNDPTDEPRMQIDDTPRSQMVFGTTVDGLKPGEPVTIDASAAGYPVRSIKDVPPGDYTVQAVLNVYETFHRSDGKTIKLAPDRGEGQHWNLAPGNLFSTPRMVHVGPGAAPIAVTLDKVIPPIPADPDTKYIKHLRIQSALLTKFWDARCFCRRLSWCPRASTTTPARIIPK